MDVDAKRANGGPDASIARIAGRQHGVISLGQLEEAGIHRQGRTSRLRAGRLHRVHRSVFAVGHRGLSKAGRWMAAVLACGDAAILSHTSAGELWGMLRSRRPPSPAGVDVEVHVTVPTEAGRRRRPGIVVHRSRTLDASQAIIRLNIPVTTPSRTLSDLRRLLPQPQFAAALRQAEFLRLPIERQLEPDGTRSELEARFLSLCRRHRLPKPDVNAGIGPFTVDFLWPAERLVVEVDGWDSHGTRSAFEADRQRDIALTLLGYDVLRFTWRQLKDVPADVARALRQLLRK
jgi:very-short-patch-repair endonuclease